MAARPGPKIANLIASANALETTAQNIEDLALRQIQEHRTKIRTQVRAMRAEAKLLRQQAKKIAALREVSRPRPDADAPLPVIEPVPDIENPPSAPAPDPAPKRARKPTKKRKR